MVQRVLLWRGKIDALVEITKGPWQTNNVTKKFNENIFREEKMKTRKDKRMVKLDFFYSQIALFEHLLKKQAHIIFGVWLFLLIHI